MVSTSAVTFFICADRISHFCLNFSQTYGSMMELLLIFAQDHGENGSLP
jgi:hypothetical protein